MKTCPICQAKSFDDMELCYACMHRFESRGLHAGFAHDKASGEEVSCTASGIPKELIQKPKAKAARTFAEPEAVIPVSGSGYNLVISLRPAPLAAVS